MLYLRDNTHYTWTRHVFVLFDDKLCYVINPVESDALINGKEDTISVMGDEDQQDETSLNGFGVRPEEMHVTEEWFHGKIDRKSALERLMEQKDKGDGVFLVRESATFIGDFSLSFLQQNQVHHVRIKTQMFKGEKRFYFFEQKQMDTLYELISYYTKHSLATEKFRTYLITPCPQPQPHLDQSWFSDKADKQRAEELLNTLKEDGAFLIRYSSSDPNVFVLSLRVEGEIWHYRLKRDGRIFVVNQTVFENLNQIVDYYQQHPFVRGVSLRFPVNERNVGQFAQADSNNTPGFYLDLSDLEKEVEAIALQAYSGPDSGYLSFPVNAVIKVISKNNNLNNMWRGRYEHSTGLFPPEVVKELSSNMGNGTSEAVSHISIGLADTNVDKWEGDNKFGIRISGAGHWNTNEWILAADDDKEIFEWYNNIREKSIFATSQKFINIKKEKTQKIAVELSNLVVYCQASPFNPNFMKESSFYEMCSLSESKHDKLIEKGLLLFNTRHLSRVYPQASRLTSTNFMPVAMWNTGCHMVALNYQTADKPMQLNQGKFQANGRCGYILKPAYLMDETFRMENPDTVVGNFPINLKIEIIAGRQLSRNDRSKGICSPFVDIEVIGLPFDCHSYRTTSISSNGLNPI
uniref:Phosphoinositide phospholipase C n=1 Tax=Panagrolaimus superbus TaxID=310955 RepID=A0A914ZCF4_9BILA